MHKANQLTSGLHREGVDGSSPSEGLPKVPANRHFVVVYSANTRTHSGHICGTRDARRRLASSSDTSVTRLVRHADQGNPPQRDNFCCHGWRGLDPVGGAERLAAAGRLGGLPGQAGDAPALAPPAGRASLDLFAQRSRPAAARGVAAHDDPAARRGEPTLGYKRIVGELKGLGISVCAASVRKVLLAGGLQPAPERARPSWRAFLRAQAASILACDFLTVETAFLQRIYVLFFISLATHACRGAERERIRRALGPHPSRRLPRPDPDLRPSPRARAPCLPASLQRAQATPRPRPPATKRARSNATELARSPRTSGSPRRTHP
jgi:hypothetical protein